MNLVSEYSLSASNLSRSRWQESLRKPKALSTHLDLQHSLRAHHSSALWFVSTFQKEYKIHGFPLQRFKCLVHSLTEDEFISLKGRGKKRGLSMKYTCPHLSGAHKGFLENLWSFALLSHIQFWLKFIISINIYWLSAMPGTIQVTAPHNSTVIKIFLRVLTVETLGASRLFEGSQKTFWKKWYLSWGLKVKRS